MKITLTGLPLTRWIPSFDDGELSFEAASCEDSFGVLIDGRLIVGIDLQYSGLPENPGDDELVIPEDPEDPTNTPKIVIGAWPDGEQWERIHTIKIRSEQ